MQAAFLGTNRERPMNDGGADATVGKNLAALVSKLLCCHKKEPRAVYLLGVAIIVVASLLGFLAARSLGVGGAALDRPSSFI